MRPIVEFWRRLPTILRAVVIGLLVSIMGILPFEVLTRHNFKLSPTIPWSFPAMAFYLWFYWQYLGGRGWPQTTAEFRRSNLRARSLSGRVWMWSLLAGGLGLTSLLALRIFMDAFFHLPLVRLMPDVSVYPFVTILSYILMVSVKAGITEEAGFRGYMQGTIERRHGPLVAILVVGIMFWLSHHMWYIGRWWLFLGHMWIYLVFSIILSTLVYLTDSILPGIVLHTIVNVLPISLIWWCGWSLPVPQGYQRDLLLWTTGSAGIVLALAALWAYRRLAVVVRPRT